MDNFLLLLLLLAIAIMLIGVAQKCKLPYPIALVLGGALLGFSPIIEPITLDPNLLLAMVLPPVLHYSAIWISFRDFKKHIGDIFSLALGLVIATTFAIGLLFKWLFPELSWALAFTFGAIISPPDAVSASTILKRFNIKPDLMTVIEGESLVNDAVALVIYKMGSVALLTGAFSWIDAVREFALVSVGGVAIGGMVGYLLQQFVRYFLPPVLAVMFSFIFPYIVFTVAISLGVSGVLAVVTSGLVTSCFFVRHYDSFRRVLSASVWSLFIILVNCIVFIMIGLQLKVITERLSMHEMLLYTGYSLLITFSMVVVRLFWISLKHAFCYFKQSSHSHDEYVREGLILGWCGMRGIISLACALALPYETFGRDIVIFITFEVIFLTIVLPGLSLPWLLCKLKLHEKKEAPSLAHVRVELIQAAEAEIMKLLHLTDDERSFLKAYIRSHYKALEIAASLQDDHRRLESERRKLLHSQRAHLIKMWEKGQIDDIELKHLELELDTEEHLRLRADLH